MNNLDEMLAGICKVLLAGGDASGVTYLLLKSFGTS